MIKLDINYCDCSGIMAMCKMRDTPVNQALCDYYDTNRSTNVRCFSCREDMGGHCDNSEAQWDARHEKVITSIKPLTEEEVFDVRNRHTYPTY